MVVSKSSISDAFVGFQFGKVYCFGDGSMWRIADPKCNRRCMLTNPRATVTQQRGKYFLAVEGVHESVAVDQLRAPQASCESNVSRPSSDWNAKAIGMNAAVRVDLTRTLGPSDTQPRPQDRNCVIGTANHRYLHGRSCQQVSAVTLAISTAIRFCELLERILQELARPETPRLRNR